MGQQSLNQISRLNQQNSLHFRNNHSHDEVGAEIYYEIGKEGNPRKSAMLHIFAHFANQMLSKTMDIGCSVLFCSDRTSNGVQGFFSF
jgi:hypothetical protein